MQRWRWQSVLGKNFFTKDTKRGKCNVRRQGFKMQGLQRRVRIHGGRAGILCRKRIPERTAEMQELPGRKKERRQAAERIIHDNLRKVRQGSESSLSTLQWQTGLLQRMLRGNEAAVNYKYVYNFWLFYPHAFYRRQIKWTSHVEKTMRISLMRVFLFFYPDIFRDIPDIHSRGPNENRSFIKSEKSIYKNKNIWYND